LQELQFSAVARTREGILADISNHARR